MIYLVELTAYNMVTTRFHGERPVLFRIYRELLHEDSIKEWKQYIIAEHEKKYFEATFTYELIKEPRELTIRQAFDLCPKDFKLWCAENDLSDTLRMFAPLIED